MKIKKLPKYKIVLLILIAGLLIGSASAYYVSNYTTENQNKTAEERVNDKDRPVNTVSNKKPTKEEVAAGEEAKKETIEGGETPPAQASEAFGVTITAANQNGSTLQVRGFSDIVTDSGSCQLTIEKGSSKVVKTAGTQASASISSCKGFDIPTSELSPGTWNLTLTITSGTQSGKATKTVVIK